MDEITKETEELFSIYEKDFWTEEEKHMPKIQVSHLVSKVAFLYEKIRNVIDYKEEHLLRKNAIKRILRRRLTLGSNAKKISQPLIYELIQARYLENKAIPESKINQAAKIIDKYIILMNQVFTLQKREKKEKGRLLDWLLSLGAVELEDLFSPHFKEEAMVRYMHGIMTKSLLWADEIPKEEREIQIYIAIHRALLKSDREIISYRLFNLYYPEWPEAENSYVMEVASNIDSLYQAVENQIDHELSSRLLRVIKKYTAPFVILEEVILENPSLAREALSQEESLEEKVKDACAAEYKKRKAKLRRSSIRSIIYIFLTKTLLGIAFEVPYDLRFFGQINQLPLIINIIFHPLLLFLIAIGIRMPGEENTEKIVRSIKKIVYEGGGEVFYKIKPVAERHIFFSVLYNLLYLITYGLTFGFIIFLLRVWHFNLVSGFFFIIFLSLVSFFGIRNRERARELIVIDEKERLLTATIDFFSIPILRVGRWISLNFSKVNIFVFIFDFIIEAPFKAFVEIIDDFFAFIREKKEEITIR